MGNCVATIDAHNKKCGRDTPMGFKYCEEHNDRPKARAELVQKTVDDISSMPEVEAKINYDIAKIKSEDLTAGELVAHITAMVQRSVQWEEITYAKVEALQGEWRFRNKGGDEMLRSEVSIYERALDRNARILPQVAKLGIDAQLANYNEVQKETIKTVLMKTLMRLDLSPDQLKKARQILAEEFARFSEAS